MDYVLMTDSSADLPWSYYKEHQIPFIPLEVTVGNDCVPDNGKMKSSVFFSRLRAGEVASTSQIGLQAFLDAFDAVLCQGKNILFLGLSSGLSESYRNACLARDEMNEKHPGLSVHICQTSSVSMGLGLMVHKARILRDGGMEFSKLCAWAEDNRLRFIHLFTVDDLMFLHRGGRVSKASAVLGSVLGIKPMLYVSHEGKLIPYSKLRGRRQSLLGLADGIAKRISTTELDAVFISHGDCEQDAVFLLDEIKKRYIVHDSLIHSLGATIGAHAGPGTVALFFEGVERTE
ncbi:MAG: DegV family protein [Oscillospiraceae bacterium]|nr:DegV family protein [Oscillospiraceae bacterium]